MKLGLIFFAVFVSVVLTARAQALDIQQITSAGGIQAWLVENHSVGIIAISAAWENPPNQKTKIGAAAMMAALLDEGAAEMDWESFRAKLEDHAINMRFHAGSDAVYGEMRTLSQNQDEAFRLFRTAITSPRFDAKPLERMRAQFLTLAAQTQQDLRSFAELNWHRAAFGRHPYGFPVEGLAKNISAISRSHLRRQHKNILTRSALSIIVVGDINAEKLKLALDQMFGGLPRGASRTWRIKKTKAPPVWRARKIFLNRPSPQTIIYFGLPGLKRDDPDFIAYYVMNHIFGGGGLTSRLAREARHKRGLVYSIGTSAHTLSAAGFILGAAATRSAQAAAIQRLIGAAAADFRKNGVSAQELADAKAYLIGSYGLNFDSSLAIARNLTYIKRHALGIDYVKKRNSLIMNVTRKDILRLARKFLRDRKMIIVMAGGKQNSYTKDKRPVRR